MRYTRVMSFSQAVGLIGYLKDHAMSWVTFLHSNSRETNLAVFFPFSGPNVLINLKTGGGGGALIMLYKCLIAIELRYWGKITRKGREGHQ